VALLLALAWIALPRGGDPAPAPRADATPPAPAAPPSPPTVLLAIDEPAEGAFLASASFRVRGRAEGVRAATLQGLDVPLAPDGRFEATVGAPGDGPFRVVLEAEGLVPLTRTVTVDTTPPVIVVSSPPTERTRARQRGARILGRVLEQNLASLTADGVEVRPAPDGAFQVPLVLPENGSRTVELRARDRAGHEAVPVSRTLWHTDGRPPAEVIREVGGIVAAAQAAGRQGDWRTASERLAEAIARGLPVAAAPAWLVAGVEAWRAPPSVTVQSPSPGARIEGLSAEVSGRLATGRTSDQVEVNGRPAALDAGAWRATATFERAGPQRITVLVRDGDEERARADVDVVLVEPAPNAPVPPVEESAPAAATEVPVPSWANPAPEQAEAARRLGVPVAFENRWEMRFVLVPAGRFRMGSSGGEVGADTDEGARDVEVERAYYVQVTEVTNEQYRRWRRSHSSGTFRAGTRRAQDLNGRDQPVAMVTSTDANEFAGWLSEQDGERAYRLPTETEWERACRAGTETRYWWGDAEGDAVRHANVRDQAAARVVFDLRDLIAGDDGHGVSAPVGSFKPNAWGLHDTLGNVWEWCGTPYGRGSRPSAAVVRGGSWLSTAASFRSAERRILDGPPEFESGDNKSRFVGFRLVSPLPGR
jgi:formylglycine-generating enzyme required for sulfatase activity